MPAPLHRESSHRDTPALGPTRQQFLKLEDFLKKKKSHRGGQFLKAFVIDITYNL